MNQSDRHTKEGFSLPDQYFEQSAKQMLRRIQEEGFETPANYFDALEAKIHQKKTSKTKVFRLIPIKWASAAAVVLLAVGSWVFLMGDHSESFSEENELVYLEYLMTDPSFITEQDLEFYFEEEEEMDDETLFEYLEEEELDWETLEEFI